MNIQTEILAALITGISAIIAALVPLLLISKARIPVALIIEGAIRVSTAIIAFKIYDVPITGRYEVSDNNGVWQFDSVIYMTGIGRAETFGCGPFHQGRVKNLSTLTKIGGNKWMRDG